MPTNLTPPSRRLCGVLTILACLLGQASPLGAQGVEVAPLAGYRFGGGFFELVTGQRVDLDGAPTLGVVVDVPLWNGLQVEGLFTHQNAEVVVPEGPFGPAKPWRISVDHWQAGGLQEFVVGHLRPHLTGTLGLTRFAAEGDNEVRFTIGAGGGIRFFFLPRVGLRLDSRVFATFVDADGRAVACSPGICLVAIDADVVWQAEFTAGIVVRWP